MWPGHACLLEYSNSGRFVRLRLTEDRRLGPVVDFLEELVRAYGSNSHARAELYLQPQFSHRYPHVQIPLISSFATTHSSDRSIASENVWDRKSDTGAPERCVRMRGQAIQPTTLELLSSAVPDAHFRQPSSQGKVENANKIMGRALYAIWVATPAKYPPTKSGLESLLQDTERMVRRVIEHDPPVCMLCFLSIVFADEFHTTQRLAVSRRRTCRHEVHGITGAHVSILMAFPHSRFGIA
jgi:hypothetical protein